MNATKKYTLARKAWNKEREKALCTVLHGLAALEGSVWPPYVRDSSSALRNHLAPVVRSDKRLMINKALTRAAIEFDRTTPKPRKEDYHGTN